MSLSAGDSIGARQAFRELVESAEPGSEAHRLAFRRLFALSVVNPDQAEPMLLEYGRWFPEPSDELTDMHLRLARGFVRRDRLSDAVRVLTAGASDDPAGSVASAAVDARLAFELGRLRLFAGQQAAALSFLERAVVDAGASPRTRTSAIRWSAVLVATDSVSVARFGRVLYAVAREAPSSEVEKTVRYWERHDPSPEEMSIVADELERAGRTSEAARVRGRLIDRHPTAPEAPVALLAIARYERSRSPAGTEPLARLERLILEYPESAVAPLARRLRSEWIASPAAEPDDG